MKRLWVFVVCVCLVNISAGYATDTNNDKTKNYIKTLNLPVDNYAFSDAAIVTEDGVKHSITVANKTISRSEYNDFMNRCEILAAQQNWGTGAMKTAAVLCSKDMSKYKLKSQYYRETILKMIIITDNNKNKAIFKPSKKNAPYERVESNKYMLKLSVADFESGFELYNFVVQGNDNKNSDNKTAANNDNKVTGTNNDKKTDGDAAATTKKTDDKTTGNAESDNKTDDQKRLEELEENAQKMKENEKSTANKMLGGLSMAATSIGGMELMSGMAEKSSDEEAERNMKSYLATFKCGFGQGLNHTGGDKDIVLPTSSEIPPLVAEYRQIAENLKIMKEQLDMQPGIESELIIDVSTTGLYDDVGIGKTGGAFTSLYRALTDEKSADAAAWAEQKAATAKKLKTGAILAGVGIVGGAVGNIAINHGKGDKSQEILNKYKGKKRIVQTPIVVEQKPCSEFGADGTYLPNCTCDANKNQYFQAGGEPGCVYCKNTERVNTERNGCECDTYRGYRLIGQECVVPDPACNLIGFKVSGQCQCQTGTRQEQQPDGRFIKCACYESDGYKVSGDYCVPCNMGALANGCKCKEPDKMVINSQGQCECDASKKLKWNGTSCVLQNQTEQNPGNTTEPPEETTIATELNMDSAGFQSGTARLKSGACKTIIAQMQTEFFKDRVQIWTKKTDANKVACVLVTGHTDFDGYGEDETKARDKNLALSKLRAEEIKNCISQNTTDLFGQGVTVYAKGIGWAQCQADSSLNLAKGQRPEKKDKGKRNIPKCRRADIHTGFDKTACDKFAQIQAESDGSISKYQEYLGEYDAASINDVGADRVNSNILKDYLPSLQNLLPGQ